MAAPLVVAQLAVPRAEVWAAEMAAAVATAAAAAMVAPLAAPRQRQTTVAAAGVAANTSWRPSFFRAPRPRRRCCACDATPQTRRVRWCGGGRLLPLRPLQVPSERGALSASMACRTCPMMESRLTCIASTISHHSLLSASSSTASTGRLGGHSRTSAVPRAEPCAPVARAVVVCALLHARGARDLLVVLRQLRREQRRQQRGLLPRSVAQRLVTAAVPCCRSRGVPLIALHPPLLFALRQYSHPSSLPTPQQCHETHAAC